MLPYRVQQVDLEMLQAAASSVKGLYRQLLHELIAAFLLLVISLGNLSHPAEV